MRINDSFCFMIFNCALYLITEMLSLNGYILYVYFYPSNLTRLLSHSYDPQEDLKLLVTNSV